MGNLKIPEVTIIRISIYSRYLSQLKEKGIRDITSEDMARGVGIKSAQIRKDLSYFGRFGSRGSGYNVRNLDQQILQILGLNTKWRVSLVGWGNLGLALSRYRWFKERRFYLTSIFEFDPEKVGTFIDGVEVMSIERLEEVARQNRTLIGIISVPAPVAQPIADSLIRAGVRGILSFVPVVLNMPPGIELRIVDLTANLEMLAFHAQGLSL